MKRKRKIQAIIARIMAFVVMLVTSLALYEPMTANAAGENLLNTYGRTYGYSGTCINLSQLRNSGTLNQLKQQYNSITLENEMKPDALLGGYAQTMSVSQARSMGYYIPSNYKESVVPKINFSTIDEVMKICYQNGLKMRAHTLVWHSQTPTWFFRNGYSGNGGFVSQSVMDARLEMYVKTVINHVYSNQYGSVVYAWDVVNEIQHATNSGWEAVYGNNRTRATYVKKAFEYAYDALSAFGLNGKVKLFSNDYNTYMCVNDEIALINYVNSNRKICDGIGMQSHLGTTYPSVEYYLEALNSFLRAGFEVQITEIDITNKGDQDMANYAGRLFNGINQARKNGGKITGITWWGLSDQTTWIKNAKPLLFSAPGVPKSAYYSVINSFTSTFGSNPPVSNGSNTTPSQPSNNGQVVTVKDGWYYFKNPNSGKYLTVANNSATQGQNVVISSGNGSAGQKWYVQNKGNGVVTIKSALNFMLDVTGGKADNAVNIEIWGANGKTSQDFMFKSAGNGQYGITTKVSNGSRCVDVANKATTDGTNVQQYDFYQGAGQIWVLESTSYNTGSTSTNSGVVSDGWYYIKNHNAQKYLQVAGNRGANATNVEIGTGTGVQGQKWYVTNTGDGYVTLKNGQGYMLDIAYGENNDGTNIQTYQANGADAQKFKIVSLGNNQYAILTKVSADKKSLDVYNFATNDGANVCQWTYYKNSNQIWYFEKCNN